MSSVPSSHHMQSPAVVARQPEPHRMSPGDLVYCKQTLHHGSKSFLAASYLLPQQVRCAATALYAFCREADDLIDLGECPTKALDVVQRRITRVYSTLPVDSPADRALRSVVQHYALPKALLDALVEGFAWDTEQRHYETLADVEDYAARVAGTVGAMMAVLMGVRDKSVLARACDLGVAMQLTNICRDVGEDARAGRCYLPLQWCKQAGVEPTQLLDPNKALKVRHVVDRLLARADELYQRADTGIAMLPPDCQRGIRMARHLYAAIGSEVQRQESYNTDQRVFVSKKGKLRLLARHWNKKSTMQESLLHLVPLAATQALVDAVTQVQPAAPVRVNRGLMRRPATTRDELNTVLQVFGRLEHIKRVQLQPHTGKLPLGYIDTAR